MKPVPVTFVNMSVTKFVPQTEIVSLRLVVNDGKDKQFLKETRIESPEVLSTEIVQEVRRKMKEAHRSTNFDDAPLAGVVVLQFRQDEDVILERTAKFLALLRERIRAAKAKRMSWYDMERQIMNLRLEY